MKKLGKLLCMVDLSKAPKALELLEENTNLDYVQYNRNFLLDNIHKYDAFWGHFDMKVDKEVLQRATNLKVINTATTGTNHIDIEYAKRKGIKILCIANDFGLLNTFTATAELAWMLILNCFRFFRPAFMSVLDGRWETKKYCGEQLSGSTLGVLGVGRLGRMTVEYGKAFRMRVLGCDEKSFNIPGVEQVDFNTLLKESDVISIHIHMTHENYHLFNENTFNKMKKGSVLINTSRGDIIDESALINALESGKLRAFGTDVIHDEWRTDLNTSQIIQYAKDHENVIITPHMGGNTTKSLVDARLFSAKKLVHYLKYGEELVMTE